MRRIEEKIGEAEAADRIQEDSWFKIMMKELSELSKDAATELQNETNCKWNKGSYKLNLYEAPPMRLLALEIAIASWLGWIMHEKHGDGNDLFSTKDCWRRIEEAYLYGTELSYKKQRP